MKRNLKSLIIITLSVFLSLPVLVKAQCNGGFVTAIRDTICSGTTGNLTLSGNSSDTIQWQSSIDDTIFADIAGATKITYKALPLQQTTWYRAKVKSGSCSAFSDTAQLYVPPFLIAYCSATQTGPNQVTFNSDSSTGAIRSYNWNFGDGSSSSERNPVHTFASDTSYYVCLTIYDGSNCSYTCCRYVTVTGNAKCKLHSYFSYTTDKSGVTTFTGSAVDSSNGASIASWYWNFGDGDTSGAQNPIHSYALGNYLACLIVTNSFGCTNHYCQQITISNDSSCHLAAHFSYTLNDSSGLAIFQDLSTDSTQGASINSWSWNFNTFNGTSTLQNPSFTFPVDSVYQVCLTVTNSVGCSNAFCQDITVNKVTGPCNITPQFSYTSDATGLGSFVDLSTDSSGTMDSWHWNFGDLGSPSDDSYAQNPTHAFTTSSIYNVCLTAGNSFGCVNTICKQVPIASTISSLCVSVFPQDSTLITQTGQQSEEYYLIKEFNTSNGDSLALVDTFTINSSLNTSHCFTNLPNGTYYVKAAFMPGSTQYSNYLPSYYNGVLLWDNATPLNLNGSQFITLMLLKGTNSGGPGFIGGYVSQGANRLEQGASTNAVGDPEPGKTVILTGGSGDAVAHTLTNAKGYFQFSNLAFGTYYLAVDELNKPCTPLEVTIDDSTGYHESANFQMNSKSVSSQVALGTYSIIQHPFAVSLAGNPVGDELTLHLQNLTGDAIISVTDLLGRELLTNNAPQQSTLVRLNVQSLSSGVYLITINSGSDVKTIKFVKE